MATKQDIAGLDAVTLKAKYTKDQLVQFIQDLQTGSPDGGDTTRSGDGTEMAWIADKLTKLIDGQSAMQQTVDRLETKLDRVETENRQLRKEMDEVWTVVEGQQRALERMDSERRVNRLIILGMPNGTWKGLANDDDKVEKLVSIMKGPTDKIISCKRIGKNVDPNKERPILVTLEDAKARNAVLSGTGELARDQACGDIKVKKDVHPAVRREWGRLYAVFDQVKNDPNNTRKNIVFDKQKRCIMKDNVKIDSWKPRFADF